MAWYGNGNGNGIGNEIGERARLLMMLQSGYSVHRGWVRLVGGGN